MMSQTSQAPPLVSVVVPARNAATTLEAAVTSALSQHWEGHFEVLLAVGPSDDDTHRVARSLAAHPQVRMVDNPEGTTPAALNRAWRASSGDVIVRLDAHAELPAGYIARAVSDLFTTGAGNVGGRQVPAAEHGFAAAVAAAMRSPLGSGGATYRAGARPGPAETVYLGVFRREALESVGGFDERLERNQDYELNHRLREAGWTVWFDPDLAVVYRPRGTVRALARQYFSYGRFKRLVMKEHPGSVRARQVAPVILVGGTLVAILLGGVVSPMIPAMVVAGYGTVLVIAGVAADPGRAVAVAAALGTMHWSWGIGFLVGPPAHVRRTAQATR
jgi:glycosyltransferase involved in cell wall biosynthesis